VSRLHEAIENFREIDEGIVDRFRDAAALWRDHRRVKAPLGQTIKHVARELVGPQIVSYTKTGKPRYWANVVRAGEKRRATYAAKKAAAKKQQPTP